MLKPELTPTSIRLNWKKAEENYGNVKFYHISSSLGSFSTKETTKLFENLAPSTTYTFEIATENEQTSQNLGGGTGAYVKYTFTTLAKGK